MKIVLVEDHPIVSQGLAQHLRQQGHTIVAEVDTLAAIASAADYSTIDILLADYKMPGGDTFEVTQALKKAFPRLKIIVLTGIQSSVELRRLAQSSIDGLLVKQGDAKALDEAITTVCRGKRFISPLVTPHLEKIETELTGREMQVLNMIVMGMARKDIAEQLGIGVESVKSHRKNIMKKLQVNSTVELILKAQELKLLDMD